MSTATPTKERPILFSGEMVKAILAGRKTQTRRVLKPQPRLAGNGVDWYWDAPTYPRFGNISGRWADACPYGQPGDHLWVRETWAPMSDFDPEEGALYRADMNMDKAEVDWRWKPSIHMPRWASRITLEITGVRVERVQDISEADAIAEGCQSHYCSPEDTASCAPGTPARALAEILEGGFLTAKHAFTNLWRDINGEGSWKSNSWVWVVSFKVLSPLSPAEEK